MRRLVVAAAGLAMLLAPAAAGAQVASPEVEGPIDGGVRGYPWNHSLHELDGYTEKEYFFSGSAKNLASGQSLPYKSRMLVRVPEDPAEFNGTVTVEWLNVTGQNDLETVWPPAGEYLMEEGAAYVAVSAQLAGICCTPTTLKVWDPVRYAPLVHPGDEFSFDIYSQAIQALLDPQGVDPMDGLDAEHIVATGASQSAIYLTRFINGGYTRGAIDVFTITRGGGPFQDFSTPIFQLNEEGLAQHHPDSDNYRLWEEAGTAHAPTPWWDYVWRQLQRDHFAGLPVPDALDAACSVNRGSVDYSSRALAFWTQEYLDHGTLPPSAPRIERDAGGDVARDEHGLAKGGLRHPFVEVPVAYNSAEGCPLWGTHRSWSSEKITGLYPTHGDYVAQVTAWADQEVADGFLLPEDRDDVVAKAQAFDAPWTQGTCYDTSNPEANEQGPLSAPLSELTFDERLPLGTQQHLREANCNAVVPAGL